VGGWLRKAQDAREAIEQPERPRVEQPQNVFRTREGFLRALVLIAVALGFSHSRSGVDIPGGERLDMQEPSCR
jgi:hypothetical protein